MRFLADAELLSRVRYVSSVSGGSVANALLAHKYPSVAAKGFTREAVDEHLIRPLLERVSRKSLKWKLLRNGWRVIGRKTRTQLLADAFDDWWLQGRRLEDLPSDVRWIFNAANITTGVRFGFERDVVGDYVVGRVATQGSGLRLAEALASSAAVPGAFAPFVIENLSFPCQNGREVKLLDGGTYDNMGLEPFEKFADRFILALNAGGLFHTGRFGGPPVVRELKRANALLYRQSTALRRRVMVERFKAWEEATEAHRPPPDWGRQGVLFSLATEFAPAPEWLAERPEHELPSDPPNFRVELATLPTSFDRFSPEHCRQLIYRGWWLTGATIATYHPQLLHSPWPTWSGLS